MKNALNKKQQKEAIATLASISKMVLNIETLETQNSDSLDFHDCSVWSIREALEAAYMAGRVDAQREVSASKVD